MLLTDKTTDGKKREVLANIKSKETGGDIRPEDIITPDGQDKHLPKEYRKFLYEFAVWIYRSLCVYRKLNGQSRAIYYRQLPQEGRGRRRETSTYLDIVLSLIRFNQENQNFFLFTIKSLHSGMNKINWSRTISHSQAVVQHDDVVYLDPVNRHRQVNYEEELFVIFFSILNYLNEAYGFRTPTGCNYELIRGKQFEAYLKGRGKIRLRQIRYKYFSDKTLQLWDLCFAFFETSHQIAVNTSQKEYLLAKSFEHVFEAMIDELIGEKNPPRGLKGQADGKHWITGKNDRGSLIYNVRLDASRKGAMPKSRIRKMRPKFAILYEEGHESENRYHVFRIHDYAEMTEDRMRQALYPREPKGDYFVFRFDEEVSIGRFDIGRVISNHRVSDNDFVEGMPLYTTGRELLKFKM